MRIYVNELAYTDEREGSDSSEYIEMIRRRADELINPPVDTKTDIPSVPTLDTTDDMPPPAQRPRYHTPPNSRRHVTNTSESTSHTQSSNSSTENTLTTRVTDGDVKIDTMLRDSPLGVINYVETTFIPGVIYRYSPFLQTTHTCVIRPSRHLHDFECDSNWYRDRYRSNIMYVSGHVCLNIAFSVWG